MSSIAGSNFRKKFTENLKPSFSGLNLLQPLFGNLFDGYLAVVDVLSSGKDGGPVLKDSKRHSLALAESDQIYISLDQNTLKMIESYRVPSSQREGQSQQQQTSQTRRHQHTRV